MTRSVMAVLGDQQTPNGAAAGLMVTPASGPAASPVTVTGGGCQPDTTVTMSYRGRQLGTVRVSQPGAFSTTIVIPTNASAGLGTLVAAGPGCHLSAPFAVQAGAPAISPGAPTGVPATQSVVGLLEVVGGLGVFGVVLLFAIRRRQQTRSLDRERPRDALSPAPYRGPAHSRRGRRVKTVTPIQPRTADHRGTLT
jgi:hypothetical protein